MFGVWMGSSLETARWLPAGPVPGARSACDVPVADAGGKVL